MAKPIFVVVHHTREFLIKSNVKSVSNNEGQYLIEQDANKKDEENVILHLINNYKQ